MCPSMAAGPQIKEVEPGKERLRRQLAAVVRSTQWSYAIFWALSARQQGLLEWSNGYYNGDIKTRKMTQGMEFKADRWGLQRSMQLRELYISLSAGDNNQCARRPSASLSPEDLTDTEWYYLVCMSFTFNHGQGLPGRALSNGSHLWLCNAHFADSKIFSRSLLAKSAYIQTVACFPIMDGVLELGTTELVFEDPNLVKQLTDSFWEFPSSICSEQSISEPSNIEENDDEVRSCSVQHILTENPLGKFNSPAVVPLIPPHAPSTDTDLMNDYTDELHPDASEDFKTGSADYSSDGCCPNQEIDDSFMNATSVVQSWQFLDDEQSNGLHVSLKTSDCISRSLAEPQRIFPSLVEKVTCHPPLLKEEKKSKLPLVDLQSALHYRGTVSAILKSCSQHVQAPFFLNRSRLSSFTAWKHWSNVPNHCSISSQKLLKSVVFCEAWIRDSGKYEVGDEKEQTEKISMSDIDKFGPGYCWSEHKSAEKLNSKFLILKSLIPSLTKVDKVSILDDTIGYLRDLERRIQELESSRDQIGHEAKGRKRQPDVSERTSDNYGSIGDGGGRGLCISKRKACDIREKETELLCVAHKDGNADLSVTISEKEVTVEVHCPWRECLLLEIVDSINNILQLDAHSVQSSTDNGMLSVTVKSKFPGTVMVSPGMIRQVLLKVLGKC